MTVTAITEANESPVGTDTDESQSIDRTFYVDCDSLRDGPGIVLSHPGIPQRGMPYIYGDEANMAALCTSRTATRSEKVRTRWTVRVKYSTKPAEDRDKERDPREQRVRWYTDTGLELQTRDVDGNAILNKAKDQYNPPLEQEVSYMVAHVTRGETGTLNLDKIAEYVDGINEDAFQLDGVSIRARECLMAAFEAESAEWQGQRYKQVTYFLKIKRIVPNDKRADGDDFSWWDASLLEHGPNQLVAGVKARIVDADGNPLTSNLDKNGAATTDDEIFTNWKTRIRKSYLGLGFH